jgi:hypothetical protein
MKVQIPNDLKADMPQTTFGKILSATPVVMAVVATMLAGLASSEMTRAQYDRSLGAQQQSKAGDQWSFFQAKRLRGAYQRSSLDLLQNVVEVRPLDGAALKAFFEQLPALVTQGSPERQAEAAKVKLELLSVLDSAGGQQAVKCLERGEVPPAGTGPALDPKVKAAEAGVENLSTDQEMAALLAPVDNKTLEEAVRAGRDRAQAFDAATKPINQAIDQMESLVARQTACLQQAAGTGGVPSLSRDFTAARLRYSALRYEVEARLNQAIANLYELQVRKSNISAERHHVRSQRFFVGMLGAQLGVIVSTFAMAARKRNLLWSLAAAAGLLAIVFAIYVYLYV